MGIPFADGILQLQVITMTIRRKIAESYVRNNGPMTPEDMVEAYNDSDIPLLSAGRWRSIMRACDGLVEDDSGRFHIKGDD